MPKISKTIWIQSLFKLSKSKYFTTLISLDSVLLNCYKKNNWSLEKQHAFYCMITFIPNQFQNIQSPNMKTVFIMHWKCQHISFKNIPKISQENSISENNFSP